MLPQQPNESAPISMTTFQDGMDHGDIATSMNDKIANDPVPGMGTSYQDYVYTTKPDSNGDDYTIARPKSGNGPWFVLDENGSSDWEENATFDANGDIVVPVAPTYGQPQPGQAQAFPVASPFGHTTSPTHHDGTTPMKAVRTEFKVAATDDPFAAFLDKMGVSGDGEPVP